MITHLSINNLKLRNPYKFEAKWTDNSCTGMNGNQENPTVLWSLILLRAVLYLMNDFWILA